MFALLAVLCFILKLFKAHLGDIDLVVLGLMFLALHFVFGPIWAYSGPVVGRRRA